jgi:hypothetical protein
LLNFDHQSPLAKRAVRLWEKKEETRCYTRSI